MRMRSNRVIETVDVLKNSQLQLVKRSVRFTIDFFLFQVFEKHSITVLS